MEDKKTLFSVIVPAYNSAAFLSPCVESVLGQTDADFELILVDDGSQDQTLALCHRYAEADARVRVLHKENGGHTSARNAGLAIATGEYILFLDSDDSLAPDTLSLCREAILAEKADIVVFGMQNRGEKATYPVRVADGCYDLHEEGCPLRDALIMDRQGRFALPKSLSAKCFRRAVIEEAQTRVPADVRIGEDGAAFVGAMLRSDRVFVKASDPRARYFCLVREGSVSRSADASAMRCVRALLAYYADLLEDYPAVREQVLRDTVSHLYTAAVIALRGGITNAELLRDFEDVLTLPLARRALAEARFSLCALKLRFKRFLLRHRLWWPVKCIDR